VNTFFPDRARGEPIPGADGDVASERDDIDPGNSEGVCPAARDRRDALGL